MEFRVPGTKQEIYGVLKPKMEAFMKDKKLPYLSKMDFDDRLCQAHASGTGFKASLFCEDQKIRVKVELGLMLKPLRAKVEEELGRLVKKIFPS